MKIISWTGRLLPACALAGAFLPQPAPAHPHVQTDTQMFVERIQTDVNGRARRTLASASRAEPGDQLIFVVNWRNQGTQPLRGLAVTRPVPAGTRLSLPDPSAQVSVDGGQNWGRIEDLWLPTPLGGTRRAVPADVTHVRWTIPSQISPGESGRLSYRATVR